MSAIRRTGSGRLLLALLLLAACQGSATLSLNDFETQEDLDRLTWRCHYWLEQSTALATSGAYGLSVEFPRGVYPTLELREVPRNWRGYRWFEADVWGPRLAGQSLMIRIDDEGDVEEFVDRFERAVELTGAPQHIRLPLDDIQRGNGGRPQDLRRMRRVLFYFQELDNRATLWLDNVRLTR